MAGIAVGADFFYFNIYERVGKRSRLIPVECIILTVSNTYIDAGGYAHE